MLLTFVVSRGKVLLTFVVSRGKVIISAMQAATPAVANCIASPGVWVWPT